ncbi:MAG: hypothetical protein RR090_06335 [Niameybacter sp.]|uniref:hypothetical protein n=1 Tax=Niameybacter sp. TaxID=2033640 RepID=UPI002FC655EB
MTLPNTVDSPYFRLFNISGIYTLPPASLDLENVTEVSATATLATYEVLHPMPDAYKIFIKGDACFRFNYSDPHACSQVHSLNYTHPFSVYIPIEYGVSEQTFNLHPLIVDCYGIGLSSRTLYYNLTLIAIASVSSIKGGGIHECCTLF